MSRIASMLAGTMLVLVGGASAQTACFGSNCLPPDAAGLGDEGFFDFYRGLWNFDVYRAQTQWNLVQTEPFERNAQCVATCRQDYFANLAVCQSVHGIPEENEDPANAQSRVNCADAMRQEEMRCISPYTLLNCPPA